MTKVTQLDGNKPRPSPVSIPHEVFTISVLFHLTPPLLFVWCMYHVFCIFPQSVPLDKPVVCWPYPWSPFQGAKVMEAQLSSVMACASFSISIRFPFPVMKRESNPCLSAARGFVKMSAMLESVGIYRILTVFCSTNSLVCKYLTSMCFDFRLFNVLLPRSTAPGLSQCIGTGVAILQNSSRMCFRWRTSREHSVIAMSSDSAVERETLFCLWQPNVTKFPCT